MSIKEFLRLAILPTKIIDSALPIHGLVYEIGSGYGILGEYLAKQKKSRNIVCIDTDSKKIILSQKMFCLKNLSFIVGRAETFSYRKCQGIVMSDFLHHVHYDIQNIILKRAARSLDRNGILLIKEINRKDRIRRWLSRFWDLILYPKDHIYYREKSELKKYLETLNFSVDTRPAVLWFPGSTHIYICRKK